LPPPGPPASLSVPTWVDRVRCNLAVSRTGIG
jgi:hypothetical protein